MNIETLEEFTELARNLSFTKTAQMFNITQSTLSKHILALEKEFDSELFDRNRHGVRLTEGGRLLFERAVGIITLYKDAHAVLNTVKSQPPITVCGDMDESDITPLLSMTATIMRDDHQRTMAFDRGSEMDFVGMVKSGKVDVAVSFFSQTKIEDAGLRCRELLSLPMLAIMSTNNPLAVRKSIRIADLRDQTLLRFTGGLADESFEQVLEFCRKHGFEPKLRNVNVTNRIEFFSTPLTGSILVWKVTEKDLGFQMETGHRALVPIEDSDARIKICAAYKEEQEENLAPFFASIEKGLQLMQARRMQRQSAKREGLD